MTYQHYAYIILGVILIPFLFIPNLSLYVVIAIIVLSFFDSYINRLVEPFNSRKKAEYLKSHAWSLLRKDRLTLDDYTCRMCGAQDRLEVHHITYKRLYHEKLSDLVCVCRDCHQAIHDEYGYNHNSEFPLLK